MALEKAISRKQHQQNLRHATAVCRNSLFLLVGLTILKAFGGYVTNIIALAGDAVGSFGDIIANLAIFIGLKLSQERAGGKFKYGMHRVETLVSLAISVLILVFGYQILRESIERLNAQAQTTAHGLGIAAALISIAVSVFTFFYQRKTALVINSQALLASAYDKRNDGLVSLGVLVGVLADKFRIPYVEGAVGIGIGVLIIYSGIKYGKDALLYLLDYWDSPEITRKIRSILSKSKIVTAVKNIRLRHAGTYIFGEAFLSVNPFTDSKDLRDEIHRLDRLIETSVPHLGDLVLYIDPPKPVTVRVALPIGSDNGLRSELAEEPQARFQFFFVEIKNGGIRRFYSREEKFTADQTTEIAHFLIQEKTNVLVSNIVRPLLYYNLRLHNIRVYPHFLGVKDVENTVKLLLLDI